MGGCVMRLSAGGAAVAECRETHPNARHWGNLWRACATERWKASERQCDWQRRCKRVSDPGQRREEGTEKGRRRGGTVGTHLSPYSLRRFAIRTNCARRSGAPFSCRKFSYNWRSQCGMKTMVGLSSGYAARCRKQTGLISMGPARLMEM